MTVTRLIMLWVFCWLAGIVKAQTDTSFWFAAPAITYNSDGMHSDRPISLHFTTLSNAATITISQPANSSFKPIQLTLAANSCGVQELTPFIESLETKPANTPLNYGLLIRSTAFISAYYEEASPNNPDIFVLKGRNALGKFFLIPAQNIMQNGLTPGKLNATSSFDIVATEDNTIVTITPTNDIIGHTSAAGLFYITLQKGQTYSATATGILGIEHLMGSTVTSNKPIAITIKDDSIGGNVYYDCEDLAGDQIVPVELLGTKYISIPGYLSKSSSSTPPTDHLFILATQNNTKITINGLIKTILNKGDTWHQKSINDVFYIEATLPVYVLQLSGYGCEVGHVLLPQIECTGSKTVGFMRSDKSVFFMHLLVPAGGETKFKLNGNSSMIPVDSFHDVLNIPSSSTQWKYARIPLTASQLPLKSQAIVTNPIDFQLSIIDGDDTGVRYGYFSNFNVFTAVPKTIPGTDKPFCENDSIQLFCDVGSSEDISFSWKGPNGFVSTEQNPVLRNLQFADAGTYTCVATKPGCSSVAISITVNVTPPIQRLLSYNNHLCEKDTLVLSVSSTTVGATFLWAGPNGYSSSAGSNSFPGVSTAISGSYILTTTDAVGCFLKDTVFVTVNPLPSVAITGNNIVCEKDSLSLNGTSVNANVVFQWNGPAGYISNTSKAYIPKIASINSGSYILTTSLKGCVVEDTVNVIVNSLPVSQITGSNNLCEQDALSLNATSSTAGVDYGWNGPANYTSNISSAYIQNTLLADSGIYVLTSTNTAGCEAKDSIVVTVNPLPLATISSNSPPCRLQTLQLNNNNILSASTYSWTHNNGWISNLQNLTINSFGYSDTGKYYLMVVSNSCTAKDSVTVGLREIPAIKFDEINGVCPSGMPIQIQASDTSGISGSGVFTGNGISSAGIFDPSISGEGTTLIRYTYTADNGCSAYQEQTVTVYPPPVVNTISPVTIFAGGTVWLNTTVTSDIKSFNWTPITGLDNPALESPFATPLSNTDYIVTVTNDKGCTASDTAIIKVLNGIKIPNAFSPNGDAINDKWMIDNLAGFSESTVNVFDRYGKRVFNSKGYNTPWDGNYNGNPLPVATYYYIITVSDGHISQAYNGWVVLLR